MAKIIITNNALNYLNIHIDSDLNLITYISVIYPLTKYAHVNITFCKKNDLNDKDIEIYTTNIKIFIENKSIALLEDAIIDIKDDKLIINAPNIYNNNNIINIKDKIKNLFENEINVILSQHGGFIELIDIIKNNTLIIKFHGGCQGCGMVDSTLNNYIEKIVKKHFPQITIINDITSHEIKDNSYY